MLNLNEDSKEFDILEWCCKDEGVDVKVVKNLIETVDKWQDNWLEETLERIIDEETNKKSTDK